MKIIDIHTHGIGGYDTRTTSSDDILKIAELHGAQGVTDIVPTIYPGPVRIMRKHMTAVKEAMERQQLSCDGQRSALVSSKPATHNSHLARIEGIHLEGPFLNPLKSGALDGMSFQKPSKKTWKSLIEGFEHLVKIVTIAPELEGAQRLITTITDMGIIVSLGHSDATYEETKKALHAGAKGITHLFNAMRGFHHREPGIAGFGLMNPDIYVEVIVDPFHLDNRTIDMIFRIKNPEKIIIVSDSVRETSTRGKSYAMENDRKILRGGSMTITESAKRLMSFGFDKTSVTDCLSINPTTYLFSGQ